MLGDVFKNHFVYNQQEPQDKSSIMYARHLTEPRIGSTSMLLANLNYHTTIVFELFDLIPMFLIASRPFSRDWLQKHKQCDRKYKSMFCAPITFLQYFKNIEQGGGSFAPPPKKKISLGGSKQPPCFMFSNVV